MCPPREAGPIREKNGRIEWLERSMVFLDEEVEVYRAADRVGPAARV